jgi:hypothetical protein
MEVRIDERRADQVAGGVDLAHALCCQLRRQRRDAAVQNADVDAGAAIGQRRIADHEVHGDSIE